MVVNYIYIHLFCLIIQLFMVAEYMDMVTVLLM